MFLFAPVVAPNPPLPPHSSAQGAREARALAQGGPCGGRRAPSARTSRFYAARLQEGPTPPDMPREFRGVWVATVDNIDWPSSRRLTSDAQRKELLRIFDAAKATNLNAIILQVRPSADALYDSKFEPWSEYLTGQQGRPPSPMYDPLEFAVAEAHKRGLELHCWFNPYRAKSPAQKGIMAKDHIAVSNPEVVKMYGPYLWMDPGEPKVQQRTLNVMLDVVRRYDVDGVHIDDYFYPYQETTKSGKVIPFPDEPSYRRYRAKGGDLAKDDWRRKNVDDFVMNAYAGIHKTKPWVKFGISPFGIYRPGFPEGIKAGVDQYADLYADARKWLREGWCDYFTPQLYWPIAQKAQSYTALLEYWKSENGMGRHLWPGLFTSRTIPGEGTWLADEVLEQVREDRDRSANDPGTVHFSMKAFLVPGRNVRSALALGPYRNPAAVPASPWLGAQAPAGPEIPTFVRGNGNTADLRIAPVEGARFYAVSLGNRLGSKTVWSPWELSSATERTVKADDLVQSVAVASVSRTGVWSETVTRPLPPR